MIKKPVKKITRKSTPKRKRKNPEDYNLIYSDKRITELSPRQVIQHIRDASEYPEYPQPYFENKENPLMNMDSQEILKYINSFADRYLHLKG